MTVLVIGKVRDSIVGDKVARARADEAAALGKLMTSGKMVSGGSFADERGGFFVLDVASSEELFELLNPGADLLTLKTHVIISWETRRDWLEVNKG